MTPFFTTNERSAVMHKISILLFFLVLVANLNADVERNAFTTAWSLVYKKNKLTNFNEKFLSDVEFIKRELSVLRKHLSDEACELLWEPIPIELGFVSFWIGERDNIHEKLMKAHVENGLVKTGINNLDVLCEKFKVHRISNKKFDPYGFNLYFDQKLNPNALEHRLKELSFVRNASVSTYSDYPRRITRLQNPVNKDYPESLSTYILRFGEDDYESRNYFEVLHYYGEVILPELLSIEIKFIGEVGKSLENRERYFKNPESK